MIAPPPLHFPYKRINQAPLILDVTFPTTLSIILVDLLQHSGQFQVQLVNLFKFPVIQFPNVANVLNFSFTLLD